MFIYLPTYYRDPDGDGPISVPIIAPELKIDSNKVEDLQLCYSIKVPDGKHSKILSFEAKRLNESSKETTKFLVNSCI